MDDIELAYPGPEHEPHARVGGQRREPPAEQVGVAALVVQPMQRAGEPRAQRREGGLDLDRFGGAENPPVDAQRFQLVEALRQPCRLGGFLEKMQDAALAGFVAEARVLPERPELLPAVDRQAGDGGRIARPA